MKILTIILAVFFSFTFITVAQPLPQPLSEQETKQLNEMKQAGIPEIQARNMIISMTKNKVSEQSRIRIRQMIMAAAKENIPTSPLMNKAMEGMVKGVKEQNIIRAMEMVASRYSYAKQLAQDLKNNSAITRKVSDIIAGCLTAGMNPEDVKAITNHISARTKNKNQKTQLTIQTMQIARTMARLGEKSSVISNELCYAIRNNFTFKEMESIMNQRNHRDARTNFSGNSNSGIGGHGGSSGSSGSGSGGGGR